MPCLTVGTDCSGMEAPVQALRNLGLRFDHVFSCDIDRHARATIEANFPPSGELYTDLTARNNSTAPSVQLYVAGFPCQPFSTAGLQQGFGDARGRGTIFFSVIDYIRRRRPQVFVLENVSGLVHLQKGEYFRAIQEELRNLGTYSMHYSILDTKQHGVPHSRRRIYMAGIRKDVDTGKFQFPEKIPLPDIEDFLDPRQPHDCFTNDPPLSQGTALLNVRNARKALLQAGKKPHQKAFIIDVDSSPYRSKALEGVSPCITCSRRSGHWVSNRGRRLHLTEMARLQGMLPNRFKQAISNQQLGKQLGNTMSVNVLERLFCRLLPAAGLVKGRLEDRWESGKAVAELRATRGCGFLGSDEAGRAQAAPTCRKPTVASLKRKFAGSLSTKKRAATAATAASAPKSTKRARRA